MLRPLALCWSVLLAPLLFPASVSAQQFCSCSTTFEWAGCDEQGVCDPGEWSGCNPSPDDGYAINPGCHVTVDGDDVLLSQTEPRRLTVRAGGSFAMRGPAELRLGPIGLVAEPGSSVELAGCFRRYGGDGEDCTELLGDAAIFPAGRVVPCRDGDCEDDAAIVRLDWSDAEPAVAARVDDLLGRVEAGRDSLCFWQRSLATVGSDSGYCYAVTAAAATSGERWLDFDVRQTWSAQIDQAGYALSRRVVLTGTLAENAPAGARTLSFEESSLIDGRAGPMGRFVRCAGDQRAYLIASATDDAAGDALQLADARGVERAYAAGSVCHVDWGWAQGDLAFVMAPVHVTAQLPAVDSTQLALEGAASLRAVVVDGLGGRPGDSAVEIFQGPLHALEHVWVTDPLVTNAPAVFLDDLPCDSKVRHLTVTGGPSEAEHDKNYGLAWFGGSTCGYSVEHLYTRYGGDDNFVLESKGQDPVASIDIRYMHAGPSSQPGDSGQLFDFGVPNPTEVHVRDALCTACTSDDGRGSLVAPSAGVGLIEDLLWVGVRNGGLIGSSIEANNWNFHFKRFGVVGSAIDPANALGAGTLPGLVADRFYVRDVHDPRPGSSRLCTTSRSSSRTRSLAHGVFSNVRLGALPCDIGDASLSDLYFIDVERVAAPPGPLVQVANLAAPTVLSRLTMAFTKPTPPVSVGIRVPFLASAQQLTLDGLLLTGVKGPQSARAMSLSTVQNAQAATFGAPTCFHGNVQDEAPAVLAGYGVAPVQGIDPQFVDPAALRFDLAASSPLRAVGCGADEAGMRGADWAHRKAKLVPIYMGRTGGYGLGAEAAAAIGAVALLRRRARR